MGINQFNQLLHIFGKFFKNVVKSVESILSMTQAASLKPFGYCLFK